MLMVKNNKFREYIRQIKKIKHFKYEKEKKRIFQTNIRAILLEILAFMSLSLMKRIEIWIIIKNIKKNKKE